MLTKQLCCPPHSPQHACTISSCPGIFIARSSWTLLLRPLSRPHRYHSGPASAFYCVSRGDHCPWSVGKSFWCLKGAWYLISTGTIWPFLLFKKGTSEPSSPGRKCSALMEKASQEVFRDITIILCPCGDLGKQHTHSNKIILHSAFLQLLSARGK